MINKQNIWFTFLCSIILVLSIIYVKTNTDSLKDFEIANSFEDTEFVINDNTELVALRIKSNEDEEETIQNLKNTILDETTDINKKNEAYDQLLSITNNKTIEQKIEKIIKESFQFNSFVKINGDNISIVIKSDKNDYTLANSVIRKVNEIIPNKYITIKFN